MTLMKERGNICSHELRTDLKKTQSNGKKTKNGSIFDVAMYKLDEVKNIVCAYFKE